MPGLTELRKILKAHANPEKAKILQGFFKTGPGEYGEGDKFLGITVPVLRKIGGKFVGIDFSDVQKLLDSKIHDERFIGILILVLKYASADTELKSRIFKFYLKNTKNINNWDLVDFSADKIVGDYLSGRDNSIIFKLARSKDLWERRIAMLSTFCYIKRGKPDTALSIAKILLNDEHDLMHKAVGWMLREIGKRCSLNIEDEFLKKHYKNMPRTMLRYAIERFPRNKKLDYMKGRI